MEGQSTGAPLDLSPLQQWAAQAHELFTALMNAGFEETEAITILVGMTRQADLD